MKDVAYNYCDAELTRLLDLKHLLTKNEYGCVQFMLVGELTVLTVRFLLLFLLF